MNRKRGPSALGESYRAAAPYLSLGIQFTASVLLCLFLGRWLDAKLGTTPFLMLGGVLLGAVAGFISFFKTVTRIQTDGKPVEGKKPGDRGGRA